MRRLPGGLGSRAQFPSVRSAIRCLGRNRRYDVARNGRTGTVRLAAGHDGLQARLWEELAMWTPRLLERETVSECTSGQP